MAQAIAANTLNDIVKTPLAAVDSNAGGFEKILTGVVDLEEFKETVDEALSEANVETSLDLTLSKDIYPETMEQLFPAVEDEESKDDIDEDAVAISIQEPVVFESILVKVEAADVEESSGNIVKNAVETIKPLEKTEESESETQGAEQALDEDMLKDLNIESMSSESDSTDGDSLLRNQSPQEQAVKLMIHNEIETFEVKLPSQPSQPVVHKTVEVNPGKILEQITRQMEALNNGSKVNIVLNPESLGKVNIQLINTKEGLSAMFTVTTQEARDLLMKGVDGLKDNLLSHGVSVDNVSIKISDAQKSEYNSDWTEQEGSRGGNKGQQEPRKEEKEKGLFEKTMKGMRE